MINPTIVLIEASNLTTVSQMALTLVQVREYFAEFHLPQPPIPDDFVRMVPGDLLITETRAADGSRTGNIKFKTNDGEIAYEKDWPIAAAQKLR